MSLKNSPPKRQLCGREYPGQTLATVSSHQLIPEGGCPIICEVLIKGRLVAAGGKLYRDVEARYNPKSVIGPGELKHLGRRVELLRDYTHTSCENTMERFM